MDVRTVAGILWAVATLAQADPRAGSELISKEAIRAYDAGDLRALEKIADKQSPWITVDLLWLAKRHDVARAFAARLKQEALQEYVASVADIRPDPAWVKSLTRASYLRSRNKPAAALKMLPRPSTVSAPVLQVLVLEESARCHEELKDFSRQGECLVRGAKTAYALRWNAKSSALLRRATRREFGSLGSYAVRDSALTGLRSATPKGHATVLLGSVQGEIVGVRITPKGHRFVPIGRAGDVYAQGVSLRDAILSRDSDQLKEAGALAVVRFLTECARNAEVVTVYADDRRLSGIPAAALCPSVTWRYVPLGVLAGSRAGEITAARGESVATIAPRSRPVARWIRDARLLAPTHKSLETVSKQRLRAVLIGCVDSSRGPVMSAGHGLQPEKLWMANLETDLMVLTGNGAFRLAPASRLDCSKGALLAARVERGDIAPPHLLTPECPRIVVSLWEPDASAGATFWRAAIRHWRSQLAGSDDLSMALTKGVEAVQKNPKWRHPYYWACWQSWEFD
jgi:hypothetical protein